MRALVLLLALCSSALAADLPTTVEVKVTLPVEVVEAIDAAAATARVGGQPATREQVIQGILIAQAQRMTQQAMQAEAVRRAAAKEPALLAFKRRVAKLTDEAEKAQKEPAGTKVLR